MLCCWCLLWLLICRYTLDSFTEISFGENPGSLNQESVPFANAFDAVQRICNLRFYDPFWKVRKVLGLGSERTLKQLVPILDNWAYEVIVDISLHLLPLRAQYVIFYRFSTCTLCCPAVFPAQVIRHRRSCVDRGNKPDLLSRFVSYAEQKGEEMTDKELRDIFLNFVIAGRDTTAILLSWAVYELTQHPEYEEALYRDACNK